MNNTNKISNEDMTIIYRVATIYGFEVRFDPDLNKLTIVGKYRYSYESFYWSSDKTFEEFFYELQRFFMDEGTKIG
jgi:hypothetical protein